MTTWSQAGGAWALLLVTFTLPGLIVAVAGRVPRALWLGLVPALSVGVVAVGVIGCTLTGLGWGWAAIALSTLLVAGTVAACVVGLGAVPQRVRPVAADRSRPSYLTRRTDLLADLLATGLVLGSLMVAMGRPSNVHQANDAPFHANAIARVASSGDPSWLEVFGTNAPFATSGFYPPVFHALGSLPVGALRLDAMTAANLMVLTVAGIVWPLGMLTLARVLWPGRSLPVWATAVLVPAVVVQPALLITYGGLWTNLSGVCLLPALVAVALVTLRPAAARGRWQVGSAAPAGLVIAVGVALMHTAALLNGLMIVALLVVGAGGSAVLRGWRHGGGRRALSAVVVAGVVVLAAAFGWLMTHSLTATTVRGTSALNDVSVPWALWQALALATSMSPGSAVLAVLIVVGLVAGVARRELRWLVAGHLITAACFVLAAGTDTRLAGLLTGLWYREPKRFAAVLAVTGIALAVLGILALGDWLGALAARRRRPWPYAVTPVSAATLAVLAAVSVTARAPFDTHSTVTLVRYNYQDVPLDRNLVTPAEAATYAALQRDPDGKVVVGDPFNGGSFAPIYARHPGLITHVVMQREPQLDLVEAHLRELSTRPDVCAAINRFGIGYVTEDTNEIWDDHANYPRYAGLRQLSGVRGLELIARDGSVSVYRIVGCSG